jgi:hypothetical protein
MAAPPERPPGDDPPRTALRAPSRAPWLLALALAMAAALYAGWRLRPAPPPPEPASPATTSGPGDAGAAPAAPPAPPAEEPPITVEAVSPSGLVRGALGGPDVAARWAAVTENLAQGESPRQPLAFLAPAGAFTVAKRGDATFIAPASYARYDGFAEAVASVDAAALARLYRSLHPALAAAYRALGYPEDALDGASARALRRLVEAPVAAGDVEVVDEGGTFTFADPKYEDLPEVEKHLLRMGPRNTRLLQAKARELQAALGGERR